MAEPLNFRAAGEWRRWLRAHHSKATEAFVFMHKKDAASQGLRYLEALDEALCFGWIDGRVRAHDANRFVLRFSPRKPDSRWSESNRERVERLVREGRMQPPGLAAVEAARRSGAWASATRPSRVPRMPADLKRALQEDEPAWSNFRVWGNSARSACIRWVLDAKTEGTRERRIARIVLRAAQNHRPSIEGF